MLRSSIACLRGMHIRTSLFALFALCAVVMGGQSGLALVESWKQVRETAEVGAIALVNRDLFNALQYARYERGPTKVALEAAQPIDPKMFAEFSMARAKSVPAVEALISACGRIQCADGDVVGNLRRAADGVAAMREKVDPAFRLALNARPADLGKQWYATATTQVNELERISLALTDKIRMVDPQIAELVGLKEAAWITRDAIGLERTAIQELMAAKVLSPEVKTRMGTLRGQADASWRIVKMLAGRPGAPAAIVADVNKAQIALFDVYAKKRAQIEQAISEKRELPLTEVELMNAANTALDAVVAVCTTALKEIIGHADHQAAAARTRLAVHAGALALALTIGAIGFLFAWRRIARPIGMLSAAMLKLAEGDLATTIPNQDRPDEIGDVARAAHTFHQGLLRMRTMEAEQKESELRTVAERKAAEERETAQQKAIEQRAAADREAAMHALADHFEAAVGHIVDTVSTASRELEAYADTLTRTTEQTQRMSGSAAAASEQASANVQSVASASEEMSSSIAEISRQVVSSSTIARDAVQQAEKTDVRIAELSHAAGRIGDVVKLITAIAEQTNLLALNATIEAARAGEAGKGFAVVAQEVKALASQTAKATDEIGTQIASMQAATGEAVTAIKEIGSTIDKVSEIAAAIAAAVEEQGTTTGEIAHNVQQAAKGTAEVAANITEVNRGATETGTAATKVLSSAQSLAEQSNRLKVEVDKFLATIRAA